MKGSVVSDYLLKNYEDYYAEGDSEWRRLSAIDKAANITSLCENFPHDSILEIGAGEGSILKRLAGEGFGSKFFALEISPTGVETIRSKGIPGLVECSIFDGYQIPYADNSFDLVILSHVIEHVEHPRTLLYEASRVAKFVFVEVPLEDTLRLSNEFVFDRIGHINFYSLQTIRRLVQTCFLQVLDQKVTCSSKAIYVHQKGKKGVIGFLIKKYVLKFLPRVAVSLFTYHSALVCRKQSTPNPGA